MAIAASDRLRHVSSTVSALPDHVLLDYTRNLARYEQAYQVLVLDHLREINTRRLFLRLGYGSLWEYVVRELEYSDGAAWRRIKAMRLCAETDGVRARLQDGSLSVSTAAELQNTFERLQRNGGSVVWRAPKAETHDLPANGAAADPAVRAPAGVATAGWFAAKDAAQDRAAGNPASGLEDAAVGGSEAGDVARTPAVGNAAAAGACAPGPGDASAAGSAGAVSAGVVAAGGSTAGDAGRDQAAGAFAAVPVDAPAGGAAGGAAGGVAAGGSVARDADAGMQLGAAEPGDGAAALGDAAAGGFADGLAFGMEDAAPARPEVRPLDAALRQELVQQAAGKSTRAVKRLLAAVDPQVAAPRQQVRSLGDGRWTLKAVIDGKCQGWAGATARPALPRRPAHDVGATHRPAGP